MERDATVTLIRKTEAVLMGIAGNIVVSLKRLVTTQASSQAGLH